MLLAGLCLLTYAHTTGFGFVMLDDDVNIIFNPHLGDLTPERLSWMWTDPGYVRRYCPLGWMAVAAIYTFSGLDPSGYHGSLVVLHALQALLLFAILAQLPRLTNRPAPSSGWGLTAAGLLAAAWAANPMQAELVSWSSGILFSLALTFGLAAVLAYLVAWRRELAGQARGGAGAAAWLLYAASLLSYPVALGVMPAAVAAEWLLRRHRDRPDFRRFVTARAGLLLLAAAALGLTVLIRFQSQATWSEVPSLQTMPPLERLAQAAYVMVYYVVKPWAPFGLSAIYSTFLAIDPRAPHFLACIALVALAFGLLLLRREYRQHAGPWLVAYALVIVPFLGLTERPHITYDRYFVWPGALMAIIGMLWLVRLRRPAAHALAAGSLLVLIGGWSWLSHRQSAIWQDSLTLYRHIDAHLGETEFPLFKYRRYAFLLQAFGHEAEADAVLQRGVAKFGDDPFIAQTARDFAARREYYRTLNATAGGGIVPQAFLHADAGLARMRQRQWREADEHFRCALELSPGFYTVAYNRALCLLELDRPDDALLSFEAAKAHARPALSEAAQQRFHELLAARRAH